MDEEKANFLDNYVSIFDPSPHFELNHMYFDKLASYYLTFDNLSFFQQEAREDEDDLNVITIDQFAIVFLFVNEMQKTVNIEDFTKNLCEFVTVLNSEEQLD